MDKVHLKPDGFELRGTQPQVIAWNDVREILGELFRKHTYDECFLLFRTASGASAAVGQLDEGFPAFERDLLNRFPGMPLNWKSRVESAGLGARIMLWPDKTAY